MADDKRRYDDRNRASHEEAKYIIESVSDCHTLYATLERAKAAMDREIEEAMENFGKGEVLHDLERLYEFRTEDGYGFTVGIDEMMPL